jgi:predicted nucleotide-binding protein
MAKVFISHSYDDKALVNQIADALHKYGHEILIDTTILKPGDDIFETLMDALKSADALLVVLTENSIRSSNVLSEIGAGKVLEGNKTFKIIPSLESGRARKYNPQHP